MIITISGKTGAGKTTVGKLLAKGLGYKFYSMGDLRGKMAVEKGLTIDELNKIGMKELWTDKEVDEYQKKLGRKEDNLIVDGWVSFHFISHSVKIFLDVDLKVGAARIFKTQRPDEPKKRSVQAVIQMVKTRVAESRARYKKHYGIDYLDSANYDCVIDTTKLTPKQVVEKILEFIQKRNIRP